jgi:two-component system, NarL family, sensor kinase
MDELVARVRAFGSDLIEPLGMAWRAEVDDDAAAVRLGAWQRREVYLILKEALHNVARHSAARSVTMRVSATRRSLDAELRDDGRGMDGRDGSPARGGHGLGNMRSRAEALGGRLEIASAAGDGTTVRLHVPLKRAPREKLGGA